MRRSLSALDRLCVCPGSGVLPTISHVNVDADVGSAGHEWIDTAAKAGEREANAQRSAIADRWELAGETRQRFLDMVGGLDGCPAPPVALTELALALLEDGTVVPIEGGRGSYPEIPGLVLPGTIDALWCEVEGEPVEWEWTADGRPRAPKGGVLWVVDWKTGQAEYVTPVAFNWQLRGAAVLAAKWVGAEQVCVALGFITERDGVRWEVREDRWKRALPMFGRELAEAEAGARAIVAEAMAQDPAAPRLVLSPHCTWCDAKISCPAYVAAPRAMLAAIPDASPGALTRDQAVDLLPLVLTTKRLLKAAEDALKLHAREHGPIPLPGGKEWGPAKTTSTSFETAATFPVLVEALAPHVGEERALDIAHAAFKTSRNALFQAVGEALDPLNEERKARGEKRITKTSVAGPMFETIYAAGGMHDEVGEEFDARWPGK